MEPLVHVVFKPSAFLQDFEFPKSVKERSGEGSLRIVPGGSAYVTQAELRHLTAKGVPMVPYPVQPAAQPPGPQPVESSQPESPESEEGGDHGAPRS